MNSVQRTCFRPATYAVALLGLAFVMATAAQAQTYTDLLDFSGGLNPAFPTSLMQGRDGNFYGGSYAGGANNLGSIYKITPVGVVTVIYSLTSADGTQCAPAPQVLGSDGNVYGSCSSAGNGYVFKVTPAGVYTHLHDFTGADGSLPFLAFLGNDGNLYGACVNGGANSAGTVFKITPSGTLTTIFSFLGNIQSAPEHPTGLVQAKDGNFYGAASRFEAFGNVFKLTPAGVLTEVFDFFDGTTQGSTPSGFTLGTDGNFYGVTQFGGANGEGTVYKVSQTGAFTLLHSFNVNIDGGEFPTANLVQASDGNFYSTAVNCNQFGSCTLPENIFKITPTGAYASLASFDVTHGEFPFSGVIQSTSGIIYGVTDQGGATSQGVFYSLNNHLVAYAALVSTAGKVGKVVGILGQGFTHASVVKFGGFQATTVTGIGSTFLSATVPVGALTGLVTVTTGATTLTSSKKFLVTPAITSFTPTGGPVGTPVIITGSGLTQTTKVTFGGVAATTFSVNSDSQVIATVPTGAVTGKIAITTAGGTAPSSQTFTVN